MEFGRKTKNQKERVTPLTLSEIEWLLKVIYDSKHINGSNLEIAFKTIQNLQARQIHKRRKIDEAVRTS